jgi:hypothetical protein
VISMMLFIDFSTASRVPLQRRGWFIFCNIMITNPISDYKLWDSKPGNSSELKNSFHWSNSNNFLWTVIDFHVIIECSSIGFKRNISMLLISIPSIPFNFIPRFALLVNLTCSCISLTCSIVSSAT